MSKYNNMAEIIISASHENYVHKNMLKYMDINSGLKSEFHIVSEKHTFKICFYS